MTRAYFRLATVAPFDQVRVDTSSSTDSPADIRTTDQMLVIAGSVLRADSNGSLPDVLGPDGVLTVYLKRYGQTGVIETTGQITRTGDQQTGTAQTTLDAEAIEDVVGGSVSDGLGYDDAADRIAVRLSSDGNNAAAFGSDGGLYVPVSSGGGSGGTSGPVAYKYQQPSPAAVWTITHALGFDPAGQTVIDTDGYVRDGFGVQVITTGQTLRLSFDVAVSGTAYLS